MKSDQPELNPFQQGVVDRLVNSATIFADRAAVYKDNYKAVGRVMEALFPDGHTQHTQEDHNRWHLFELVIVKLTRYVNNYERGHEDSLDDMIVYLSMLGQLDVELRADEEQTDKEDEGIDFGEQLWRPGLGKISLNLGDEQDGVSVVLPSFGALVPEAHLAWGYDANGHAAWMKRVNDQVVFLKDDIVYLRQHLDNAKALRIDHFDPEHGGGLVIAVNAEPGNDVSWVHPTWISHQPVTLQTQIDELKGKSER